MINRQSAKTKQLPLKKRCLGTDRVQRLLSVRFRCQHVARSTGAILCIAFLTLFKMFSSAKNTQSNSKLYVLTMIQACKQDKKAKSIFRLLILFLSYYRSQVVLQVWNMQWQVGTKENFSSHTDEVFSNKTGPLLPKNQFDEAAYRDENLLSSLFSGSNISLFHYINMMCVLMTGLCIETIQSLLDYSLVLRARSHDTSMAK